MLDKLIKTSTLIGAFLIFCGVLKLMLFYNAFNIRIIDYLTFSEIITSFLDDINVLLLLVALMIFQSVTVFGFVRWKNKMAWDHFLEATIGFVYAHKKGYLIFFCLAVLILSGLLAGGIVVYHYAIIYAILFFILQFFTTAFMTKDEEGKIETPDELAILSGLITILIGIFLLAQHDIERTISDDQKVELVTEKETFHCGDGSRIIFVGKTDGYTFLFNTETKASTVLPMNIVDKMQFN
ncbi:hypothetical protein [Chryseosolibacter indicus]|uniref:Uncharacterized protein n=1 Tax=Chryseosolibacter indicus TaxID=2782351 RepID=A0ABS5VX13_9BACT|nr:hypothetical protein [Chryseosolibacter indicus]MBT1705274.1 hypothetical protein [Chryseosolibacter indicus]